MLHLEEDLHKFGCDNIEDWITSITLRLGAWYEHALFFTAYNMLEFKIVQYHHLIARIHRPTPRLRARSPEDRQIVLNASLILIDDYLGQEQRHRLFYPWHGLHILFETATIALEACWSSRFRTQDKDNIMSMLKTTIPQCIQIQRRIGQRWNEALLSANRLEAVLQSVLFEFGEFGGQYRDLSITKEIEGLLFSDGPLTWNGEPLEGNPFIFTDDTDLVNSPEDDIEFFQWDLQWDLQWDALSTGPLEMA